MNIRRGSAIWLVMAVVAAISPACGGASAEPASAAGPADRAISPDLRAKMLKLIASVGREREIPAPIAGPLGLSAAGAAWPDRQFAFQWNGGGAAHAVAIGRGGEPDIVLTVRGPAAVSVFRARADGTLQNAVNYFIQTSQTSPLPAAEAQAEFAEQVAFWTANIDAILAQD